MQKTRTKKKRENKKKWSKNFGRKKCWSILLVEIFRAVENHGASLIYCNFSSFQYFSIILDAFDAQRTGAFNAPKNIKNGSVVKKLSSKNLGVSN